MMRSAIAATLAATLVIPGALPVLAEDESPAPTRVEVPAAGMAVTFPAEWGVDIEMRPREDWGLVQSDDEHPLVFWKVIYASSGGRPWCDLTWYPVHPMPLPEHAQLYEALMTPTHSDVERSIEVTPAALPAGESYRFVVYNEPTRTWTTTYLLDAAGGRYFLQCAADERAPDDWLGLAQSLESVALAAPAETIEPQD